jgi:DNA repair photolyase
MAAIPLIIPAARSERDRTLVGLAKVAAESPHLAVKRRVEYFNLRSQSILNRCSNPHLPFLWTINPYRGCEFGCKYCYARYTHEFMGMENPADFEEKIYSKERAAEILERELRQDPGGAIAIGTATDPYQPAERLYRTTRGILETLATFRGLSVSVTTKSDLVVRDVELLREVASGNALQVNITITTLQPDLGRRLEPQAPRPDLRLQAVRKLAEAGIPVTIFAMPVLPGLTDDSQDLEAIARAGAEAGARSFATQVLFLMPSAQKAFLPFLQQQFPQLVSRYQKLYQRRAYLRGTVVERIDALAARLRKQYYPPRTSKREPPEPFGRREQLALFHDAVSPRAAPHRPRCGA